MKDFLNTIEDFCSENYIWLLVGAAVLLLLIIAAATGASFKASRRNKGGRSEADNREYFLEGEYDELLRRKAQEHQKAEESEEGEASEESEASEDSEESTADEEVYKPEDELEALSDQPVCININIEHGQVKIGYDADGQLSCRVQAGIEEPAPADENEESCEKSKDPEDDNSREIIMEKINLIKGAPARKFGPDNLNTGRFGRIYTEEELHRQIKE